MIIDTIRLSAASATTIRLGGKTLVSSAGKPVRRASIGGRIYIVNEDVILVKLSPEAQYKDMELALDPPVDIEISDGKRHENVSRLLFSGSNMQIFTADRPQQPKIARQPEAAAQQTDAQVLTDRENQLISALQEKQNRIRQLEQSNQEEEERIAQLTHTATLLKRQRAQLESINGTIAQLERDMKQVNADLSGAQTRVSSLEQHYNAQRAVREKTAQDNEITAAAITFLEEQIADEKRKFERLQHQETQLNAELKNYSPEIIENLQSSVQSLQDELAAAKSEWTKLSGERLVWENQLKDQRKDNDELTRQIAQQPEEFRILQEAHEKLSLRLTQTIHAQEMCSEEKQQALRAQLAEKEPIARQLTEQCRTLEQRDAELNDIIAQQQQAKDAELLALWPRLTQSLQEIRQCVGNSNAELESLLADAGQFNQHVRACAERMEQLKEWYHVDRTPLQKLLERLNQMTSSENEQLLQTMNPMNIDLVRQQFETVEVGLNRLDDILKDAIRSAQNDEKFINLKTTTNDQHARQEMKR